MSKKNSKQRSAAVVQKPVKSNGFSWMPLLLAFVFFIVLSLGATGSSKGMTMLLILVTFGAGIIYYKKLQQVITVPMITLALFVLMCGISTLYAASGIFALYEFLKVLMAFCLALLLVLQIGRAHV